jgi:hypothetical protein
MAIKITWRVATLKWTTSRPAIASRIDEPLHDPNYYSLIVHLMLESTCIKTSLA